MPTFSDFLKNRNGEEQAFRQLGKSFSSIVEEETGTKGFKAPKLDITPINKATKFLSDMKKGLDTSLEKSGKRAREVGFFRTMIESSRGLLKGVLREGSKLSGLGASAGGEILTQGALRSTPLGPFIKKDITSSARDIARRQDVINRVADETFKPSTDIEALFGGIGSSAVLTTPVSRLSATRALIPDFVLALSTGSTKEEAMQQALFGFGTQKFLEGVTGARTAGEGIEDIPDSIQRAADDLAISEGRFGDVSPDGASRLAGGEVSKIDPLIEEARKFDTAEEFLDSLSEKEVFHGGRIESLDDFDPMFKGATGRSNDPLSNLGINLSDKQTAEYFSARGGGRIAGGIPTPNKVKKTTYNKLLHEIADRMEDRSGVGFGSQIRSLKTTAEKNNFLIDNLADPSISKELAEDLLRDGFDAIEYRNTLDGGTTFIPLKKDAIKTKQQLTDIWKKAQAEDIAKLRKLREGELKEARAEARQLDPDFEDSVESIKNVLNKNEIGLRSILGVKGKGRELLSSRIASLDLPSLDSILKKAKPSKTVDKLKTEIRAIKSVLDDRADEAFRIATERLSEQRLSTEPTSVKQKKEAILESVPKETRLSKERLEASTSNLPSDKPLPIDTPEKVRITKEKSSSPELYDRNFEKVKTKKSDKKISKSVKSGLNRVLTPISTRLKEIDPSLKNALRKFEFNVLNKGRKRLLVADDFLKSKSKMSDRDLVDFDLAEKNRDVAKVAELVKKYGLEEQYAKKRKLLDDLYKEAEEAGYDIKYLDNFSPRVVKDPEALLDYLRGTEAWGEISEALATKEAQIGRMLTVSEKASLVNTLLRGFPSDRITLSTPGALKRRSIEHLDENLNEFYKNSDEAFIDYIGSVTEGIEARKFFGRTGDSMDIQSSIGNYTMDLVMEGKIKPAEEIKVREILQARFNPARIGPFLGAYRNISYMTTIANPISTITQIGDLAFSLYKNGVIDTSVEVPKALIGKSKIKIEDIGVEKIAQEFVESPSTQKALEKALKIVGFEKMDRIGKETFINSSLKKFQGQAKSNPSKLKSELESVYGKETDVLIEDLKSGKATDNVRLLLFNELLDIQPIALSEMPEMYLRSGGGRVLYMLKTFTIKQLDVFRNEAIHEIQKGNIAKGIGNFVKLGSAFALMNASSDMIKDFILDREMTVDDLVVDNMLKIIGLNKYVIYQAKTEGVGEALISMVAPPLNIFRQLARDQRAIIKRIEDKKEGEEVGPLIQDLDIVQSIPVGGKLYYWWLGRGVQKTEKKRIQRSKDEVRDMIDKGRPEAALELQEELKSAGTLSKKSNVIRDYMRSKYGIPGVASKSLKNVSANDVRKVQLARENMTDNEWNIFINTYETSSRKKLNRIANMEEGNIERRSEKDREKKIDRLKKIRKLQQLRDGL